MASILSRPQCVNRIMMLLPEWRSIVKSVSLSLTDIIIMYMTVRLEKCVIDEERSSLTGVHQWCPFTNIQKPIEAW